jgi:hypothetical protein
MSSIDVVDESFSGCELSVHEPSYAGSLDEREVWNLLSSINLRHLSFLRPVHELGQKCAKIFGNYHLGNRAIGRCDLKHVAYHQYLQAGRKPILLCEHDGCIFELYRFQRLVGTGDAQVSKSK